MNSTRWETLNSFIKHLGQTGKCKIENSDKGYYIEYINQDPLKVIEKEKEESRVKSEVIEEERKMKEMKRQLKKMKKEEEEKEKDKNKSEEINNKEINNKSNENENNESDIKKPIAIEIKQTKQNVIKGSEDFIKNNNNTSIKIDIVGKKRKINNLSNVDLIMKEEEEKKKRKIERLEKENRSDNWICPNIIVKIKNKEILEGKLYKRKAYVISVKDKYFGYLKVIDSGTEIGMDQDDLETVIPKKGKKVMVLNGAFRNSIGEVISVNIAKYNCTVLLLSGDYKNEAVDLDYEDISELYE